MFDHVGIAVSDRAASEAFYRTVLATLGAEPVHVDEELVEWEDWDVQEIDGDHALTRGLHVGFRAPDRAAVDAFGGVLLDPDGNSVEAVHNERERAVPPGGIDHLWLGVRDLDDSRRFYETIAPHAGVRVAEVDERRVRLEGEDFNLSLVADGRPPTKSVHIAFGAAQDSIVRDFYAAAIAAGYEDNGAPGERLIYHPGYYGAFVLDPDGNNIEVVNHNRDAG